MLVFSAKVQCVISHTENHVHTFQCRTFDDVTVRPSPGLNVVLGPNGTGKSSIVCALCLGLAGNPGLLGRAREVSWLLCVFSLPVYPALCVRPFINVVLVSIIESALFW